jgi:hypothetical protein
MLWRSSLCGRKKDMGNLALINLICLGIHCIFIAVWTSYKKRIVPVYQQTSGEVVCYLKMLSSGMLCHVALVRSDVSEEHITSIIRVTRISKLRTMIAVTSNCSMLQLLVTSTVIPSSLILVTLIVEAIRSSETSVLTRATWCNIPEDGIFHSHCHENLKSYMVCYQLDFSLTSSLLYYLPPDYTCLPSTALYIPLASCRCLFPQTGPYTVLPSAYFPLPPLPLWRRAASQLKQMQSLPLNF